MKFLFAWRYFKSKKTTNAINIIAWISVLAIAVGTAALIVVLSVFNGFEDLVKGLYGDFYSDIKVVPAKGKFFELSKAQLQKISSLKGIKKFSFVAEEKAVLVNGDYQAIIYLKGVDENNIDVNGISKHIERGKYKIGSTEQPLIIVGGGIENAVGADPENNLSDLTLYLPNRTAKNLTSLDAMNAFNVNVAGTFRVQEEFDNKYAFTNLPFVQYMLNLEPNEYSSIEIALNKDADYDEAQQLLQKVFGREFTVQSRFQQNQSLFTIMQIEKWVIYGILSLILLIAAFNMIGALTMLVLEKQKDIAVLKAMGASNLLIQNIFLSEGFVLAGIGGITGMLIAFAICTAQLQLHLIKLEGGTFIIDYYPVKLSLNDFLLVGFTVFVVAVLAAWIPSRKAGTQFFSLKS
jgi:lipoprotein-releasing system permease protein